MQPVQFSFCFAVVATCSHRLPVFLKKKSGIFSSRVNDILTSILSALHPFLPLPNNVLKRERGTFFSVQAISWKAQIGTFFAVGSNVLKSADRYLFCSWKWCSQRREKDTFKVFKNINSVFKPLGSHLKSYWLTDVNRWHLLSFSERYRDFFRGF